MDVQVDAAHTEAQCALQYFDDARAFDAQEAKSVGDHVKHFDVGHHALAMEARVPLRLQVRTDFVFAEILGDGNRKRGDHLRIAGTVRMLEQFGVNAVGAVPPHRPRAAAAEKRGCAREQQLQMIVQLGHRADRAARRAHRIGLVDRDCRRHAFDAVHRRTIHPIEKLARVRRERLYVAPLALRVQRIEDERALARARNARYDDQFAGGNVEIEIAKIVLTGAANANRFARRCRRCRHRLVGKAAGAAAKDSRSLGEVSAKCRALAGEPLGVRMRRVRRCAHVAAVRSVPK